MKKWALVLCAAFLASCVTKQPPFDFSVAGQSEEDPVKIAVTGFRMDSGLFSSAKPLGVDLTIENTSADRIIVKWRDSSIVYDKDSHRVFLSGHRFTEAVGAMPDQPIGPGATLKITVYPADNFHFTSGREGDLIIFPIPSNEISVRIFVVVEGEARPYTVQVNVG